ncbi:protein phosphatase 1 regulatory subunit 37, partial [Cricetulus griseus]
MALSLALKVNHSLLRLDLDREPKKEAVKTFIETQKALLAEIQNGCKRNFVLVREREKQPLQPAASMPEITITAPRPLDEPGDLPAAGAQNGAPGPGPGPDSDSDSDSDPDPDREEQEEEEEEAEDQEQQNQQRDEGGADRSPSAPCPALIPSTDSLGPGDRSPPGSPSAPAEQRISVSSPGRGHKVFVVTRVESPPERPEPPVPPTFVSCPPRSPPSPPASRPPQTMDIPDPESSEAQLQPQPPQAGQPLPNGLKPEFALALPPEPPPGPEAKGDSCSLEH